MRKTLALLLAVAFLTVASSAPLSTKSQAQVASGKFQTVANPIPNQYIVVLATTDLSPIAEPAPTPKAATPIGAAASPTSATASSLSAMSLDSSSTSSAVEPAPDPTVVATATNLTLTYGGTFNTTWGVALKGFRLNATETQAIAQNPNVTLLTLSLSDRSLLVTVSSHRLILLLRWPNLYAVGGIFFLC